MGKHTLYSPCGIGGGGHRHVTPVKNKEITQPRSTDNAINSQLETQPQCTAVVVEKLTKQESNCSMEHDRKEYSVRFPMARKP